MIPVEQTILTQGEVGNCFAACLASILELPLEAVPHVMASDTWFEETNDWLRPRGLVLLCFSIRPDCEWRPRGYAILGARSPRGDCTHAVVCRDGEIVWDPHPRRALGVGEWLDWMIFQALDPAVGTLGGGVG